MIFSPLRTGGVLLGALLVLSGPLAAQGTIPERARTWAVDSVLASFERDTRANVVNSTAMYVIQGIFELPNTYQARRDSLLNGLERLALTSDSERVRQRAASRIASAGTTRREAPPIRGIMPRLVRLYRATSDGLVQLTIRDYMPEQAERPAALALLRSIAAEPDPYAHLREDPIGDERIEALSRLSEMGEEGQAVLQAMHRTREARSPQARAMLAEMARRGFPVRDNRRSRARP